MHRLAIPSLVLLLSVPAARAQFGLPGDTPASKAEMVSEAKTIAGGSTFTIGLKLDHPKGWHSYYLNSGGIEESPSIKWALPEGFSAGPIQWPAPEVKDGFFGKSFVYSGTHVFLVDIKAPATLESGKTLTLTANASWQICEESCKNEAKKLTLALPVGLALEKDPALAGLFENARASQASQAPKWKFSAQSDGGDIQLRVEPDGALGKDPTDFIPDQPFVKSASSGGSIKREANGWLIQLPRATKNAIEADIPQGKSFSGILTGSRAIAVPDTLIASPAAGATAATEHPSQALPFFRYLLVLGEMLLGGLILNLMPCVFPVIGLKIMGFVKQAGSDRRKVALHGLAFTLGVLVSFGVLSAILISARATTGWGYQLQYPWVVLTLMLLMFVMALNMYGVFEMGTSATAVGGSLQAKQGLAGSFFSGALATVVATPCSGPILGAAIGIVIGLPAAQFFSAFAAMALGLALPYLVLSVFPNLIGYLPRPGAWMESFKQAMSFLLFASVGYLLWVYSGLIDVDNLLGPIFGLSAIAVAGWIHGRWNLPHRTAGTRRNALCLTVLFAAAGIFLAKPPGPSTLTWEPWSEARVNTLLADNKPVYIDFTAKWCALCQVNKKRAYTKEVVDLMLKKGVVTLKGDKTRPDPEIEAALNKLGRTAIPVNVMLQPGKDPVIFPELLAPGDLIEALKKL